MASHAISAYVKQKTLKAATTAANLPPAAFRFLDEQVSGLFVENFDGHNANTLKIALAAAHEQMATTGTEHAKKSEDLIRKTKEQITALDAALTEELSKSLSSLGRQLAALSEKFVSDYRPLTESLRNLVQSVRV